MNTPALAVDPTRVHPSRQVVWVEWFALALGIPATIWIFSKAIPRFIPAAEHGSVGERFLLWILAGAIAEWLFVAAIWFILRRRASGLNNLGVWRWGTWSAWTVALLFGAMSISSNLRFFPRMHIPISSAFLPTGFHLAAALMMGITAGFCEEVLFRAFLMSEFASAGYGKVVQVVIPGIAFGLAHAGFLSQGFVVWLGIMLPTAFLGMMWGISYLLGRRSLIPAMTAHFLNDATALPWLIFFMVVAH